MTVAPLHHWAQRTFAALRHPIYRLYWISSFIGLAGWFVLATAQQYVLLEVTGNNASTLGLVTMLQFLPSLLFSLFAGVIVDRFSRRGLLLTLLGTQLLMALTLGLAVQTGHISVGLILGLSFLSGTVLAFDLPVRQTLVAEFVPRDDLPNALALGSLSMNISRTIGPALFGALAAWGLGVMGRPVGNPLAHFALPFYATVVCLAVSVALTTVLPMQRPVPQTRPQVLSNIGEGLRYARHERAVLVPIAMLGLLSLSTMNFTVMIPYYAKAVHHATESQFGLLSGLFGLGAIVAALWQAARPRPMWGIRAGVVLLVVLPVLLALTPNLTLLMPVYAALGFASLLFMVSCNSAVQLSVSDQMRGRVMSLYSFVFIGMSLPGALIASKAIDLRGPFGPQWGMLLLSLAAAITAALSWRWLPKESAFPTKL